MDERIPGPFAIIMGFAGLALGFALAIPGVLLQMTFMRPMGVVIMEQSQKLSYHSGRMIGSGFADTFKLIGMGFKLLFSLFRKQPAADAIEHAPTASDDYRQRQMAELAKDE